MSAGAGAAQKESCVGAIFPRNERGADRAIRVVLGTGLLSLVWVGPQLGISICPIDIRKTTQQLTGTAARSRWRNL